MAKKYHCAGVQFRYGLFDVDLIRRCHEANLFCNVFFADTEEGYKNYFDMGIDTILTNRMDLAAFYVRKS